MQNDIVTDPIEMRGGWIEVRDAPGLGVTVDEAAVQKISLLLIARQAPSAPPPSTTMSCMVR